jgi:hypothetical protein
LSAPLLVEMAPLPSLIPPCQTADPWVFISGSPCCGQMKELASRQNVNDLEEVVRRNAERAHEAILNRP